jgi:hypothetical protein
MDTHTHATIIGSPGEKARIAGLVRTMWPLLLCVAAAGYLLRAAFPLPALSRPAAGGLCLLLAVGVAVALAMGERRLAAFLKGARGEERVAHALAFLPAAFTIFHGVSVRGMRTDCDHVVVGPTGVFAIETKYWSGRVSVEEGEVLYNGLRPSRSPVKQARDSARSLQTALNVPGAQPVPVLPVVCLAGSEGVAPTHVADVAVCNERDIAALVQRREPALDDATRARVITQLRQALTES